MNTKQINDAMKSFAENPLPPTGKRMKPSHPGEILRDIALPGTALSISKTAQLLGVSRRHLRRILDAERPVTPEIAVRLSALFNTSAGMWLNMQAVHDTWEAERSLHGEVRRRLVAANKTLVHKADVGLPPPAKKSPTGFPLRRSRLSPTLRPAPLQRQPPPPPSLFRHAPKNI